MALSQLQRSILFGALLILSATIGKVAFKTMTDAMPRYPYFLSIFITMIAVPFYFITMAIKRYMFVRNRQKGEYAAEIFQPTDDSTSGSGSGSAAKSYRVYMKGFVFPKYRMMIMGALDSLAGILMVFGGNGTSGPLQALLYQGVIPLTMTLSFIFLKTRYKWQQYYGAWLVLVGVFIVFSPQIFMPEGSFYWPLITFAADIPTAVSAVYKEHSFKKMMVNVFYLQAWVSLFQFLSALLLFPLNLIPTFGNLSVTEVPTNFWSGLKCFVGVNSFPSDTCHNAWIPVIIYTICNFSYNIFSLYVLKELNSAVVFIQNALRLPIVTVIFHFSFLMGTAALPWDSSSYYTFGGLAVILLGLVFYMFQALRQLKAAQTAVATDKQDSPTTPLVGTINESPPIATRSPPDSLDVNHFAPTVDSARTPKSGRRDRDPIAFSQTPPV